MLEEYFVKPDTVDRIRASWMGPQIERYVAWLAGEGYRPRTVLHRVPMLLGFAEFAWGRGARTVADLPAHVEAFVAGSVYRTIFALCYGLGLRAGEACGLRVSDVDPARQLLVVRGGKFGNYAEGAVMPSPVTGLLARGTAARESSA
jgi:integrase